MYENRLRVGILTPDAIGALQFFWSAENQAREDLVSFPEWVQFPVDGGAAALEKVFTAQNQNQTVLE